MDFSKSFGNFLNMCLQNFLKFYGSKNLLNFFSKFDKNFLKTIWNFSYNLQEIFSKSSGNFSKIFIKFSKIQNLVKILRVSK